MFATLKSKNILAWTFYDWANSAFATTVMAGFFPLFFKQYWSANPDSTVSTFQLGLGNTGAALLVVLLAPLMGVMADLKGIQKRLLLIFALLGVLATAGLYWVQEGDWVGAILCYGVAILGFMGANVFYDALLVSVARPGQRDMVSAAGYAMGYLGGGVLFSLNVAMTLTPEFFGLSSMSEAVRLSFLSVSIWWALFTIPLLLLVKEQKSAPRKIEAMLVIHSVRQLVHTVRSFRDYPNVLMFLLAYWLYIDGVDTIVRMAVDYGLSIGLETSDLITALLITQFVGFPSAFLFGYIGQSKGAKTGLFIALGGYIVVTCWATIITEAWEFYALAIAIGLVQGGVQSLSRSFYASIIPSHRAGEFFGFYNMMGKSAAMLGPLLVGAVSLMSGSHRVGIFSIIILFVAGFWLLMKVDVPVSRRE